MDLENLSEKYQLLLEENLLLRERISSLEAALNDVEVSLIEDNSTDYIEFSPVNISTPIQAKPFPESEQQPIPTLDK